MRLFDFHIDNVSLKEATQRAEQFIAERSFHYIVTPNAHHIALLENDSDFKRAVLGADMVLADGMPLVWLSRMVGKPLKERVTGADVTAALLSLAQEKGYSVFFLFVERDGGSFPVVEKLAVLYPGMRIAGHYSVPFGFEWRRDRRRDEEAIAAVTRARPDVLIVLLGAAAQEKWIGEHREALRQVPLCIGAGAAIDFIVGRVKRAPLWIQRCGLEWLFRLSQEPRRLWKRYLVTNCIFLYRAAREIMRQR